MNYDWKYCSLGGVVRVNIESGEDIAHLGELDQKLWTVLSCPVEGLEFDARTLKMLDTDADGKIRVVEVVAAAQWLTSVVKDKDAILKGESVIPLDQFNTDDPKGARLLESARQILHNLGLEKDSISIEDTSDSIAIFKNTLFNGDGIVTPAVSDDAAVKDAIESCMAAFGSAQDRCGEAGVDADRIEKFYAACADYAAWQADGQADPAIFPFGADTAAALAACDALKDKIADYFMRCKLVGFNDSFAAAVDVPAEKVAAISDQNLATCEEEIARYPLARPSKEGVLPFDGINPAWRAAFNQLKDLVFDKKDMGIDEAGWKAILAKFDPYCAWMGAKKGAEVEGLGLEKVQAILAADAKQAVLDLIAKDAALKEESESIDEVDKLTHLYRDFYTFLKNYVFFSDFYAPDPDTLAVFQAGKLYIDQRCCDLCVKVTDMGKHADMAGLSGMFLIYCHCSSKVRAGQMDIVAAMTDGGTRNLRPGKNGVFYDRNGLDWDATIIKVVENPISVRQAFWSPYVKFGNFIRDKVTKSAAEKDANAVSTLQSKAEPGAAKQPFDIAKYAGIFAAVGMALAGIGLAIQGILNGVKGFSWWQWLILIAAIMLIISGPSCFLAWLKLRKRNLGPVLNANGWAINSVVLVNILFGATLTSVAKYPAGKYNDPYKKVVPLWRKILRWIICLAVIAFGVLYFTDNLGWAGIHRRAKKEAPQTEVVVEAEAEAPEEVEATAE